MFKLPPIVEITTYYFTVYSEMTCQQRTCAVLVHSQSASGAYELESRTDNCPSRLSRANSGKILAKQKFKK